MCCSPWRHSWNGRRPGGPRPLRDGVPVPVDSRPARALRHSVDRKASGPSRPSCTLAAWVRMDPTTRNATVLGQNGVNRSPFLLGYEQSLGKWSFRAVDTDAPKSGTWSYQRVVSKDPAVPGVWTHLALGDLASPHWQGRR
ncbi:LamG-like jellyroll fold domain-containing protein [Streptomyces sp. NPDC057565]|uniref:LamG-like jellyroll fold domain-containing protein n=1 Tax=Streptomyces sp. NPDC057565 TaxID=3346169 RepID=UPI0036934899